MMLVEIPGARNVGQHRLGGGAQEKPIKACSGGLDGGCIGNEFWVGHGCHLSALNWLVGANGTFWCRFTSDRENEGAVYRSRSKTWFPNSTLTFMNSVWLIFSLFMIRPFVFVPSQCLTSPLITQPPAQSLNAIV